jgi:hypothetical protein
MAFGVEWRCFLLATVLGVVSCQNNEDDAFPSLLAILGSKLSAGEAASPIRDENSIKNVDVDAPCCFPNVWQGRVVSEFGYTGRKPGLARAVDAVFGDGATKRLAGNKLECHTGARPANFSYILLVGANSTGDLYLFNKTGKQCRYLKLNNTVWKQQCLPANSTLRGTRSLGPATGGLTVQSWTFHVGSRRSALEVADRPRPRPQMSLSANVLVVPKSCIPVVIQESGSIRKGGAGLDKDDDDSSDSEDSSEENNFGGPKPKPRPRGVAFAGGMYFSDMQTRIVDPSVFTPPSYCKKTSLFDDDMGDVEDIIPSVLANYLLL